LTAVSRLLTPNPKESVVIGGAVADANIDIDLGAVKSIDTLFLGYVSPGMSLSMNYGVAGVGEASVPGGTYTLRASELFSPSYHLPVVLSAPISARYIRFLIATPAAGFLGTIAAGLSFQATWGHEYGAGRPIEDTGSVERLKDGSFGIDEGVAVGGYQWTFGDLTDVEVQKLYAIARDRGQGKSVLVIEDPDQTDGLNERTHWGLFDKLEPYERLMPGASRYAFRIRDWA
jgi:hypothetical protein